MLALLYCCLYISYLVSYYSACCPIVVAITGATITANTTIVTIASVCVCVIVVVSVVVVESVAVVAHAIG